jgi:hypothetical protein
MIFGAVRSEILPPVPLPRELDDPLSVGLLRDEAGW